MCLAIPGKIIEINGLEAIVQYPSESRRVLVGEDNVQVGDYVMVQMGIVIKVISKEEAEYMLDGWKQLETLNS